MAKPAARTGKVVSGKVVASQNKPAAKKETSLDPGVTPSQEDVKKESNPFTDRDWRMWIYAWSGFGLRIMLVFGTIFSVYQYLAARQDRRVERTLALVERWEGPEFQKAQTALKARLGELNGKYQSLLGATPSPAELGVYYRKIGSEAMTADGGSMPLPEFQIEFDKIVYFLNRVSACSTSNLCAPEVADEYFHDFARSFWDYFAGYVQQQRRRGSANFAKPLEDYLKSRPDAGQAQPAG